MGEEKEKPLTRADVRKRIKEHGGPKELDLSGKVFEEAIDLRELDLGGIILNGAHLEGAKLMKAHLEGAILVAAHLEGARLEEAHLERARFGEAHLEKAVLWSAHLEGANLVGTNLEKANLVGARLEGAHLSGVEFTSDTRLENIRWGNFILGEEKDGDFDWAADTYKRLKRWYTTAGMYDIAGEFFFREMTARRKQMAWRPNPIHRAWSKFISLICGYGERPLRVIAWAGSVVVSLALIYFLIGSVWELSALWRSLYFSAVSFTALGYGSWLNITNDWIRAIGAFESFIGVFSIALFLVTFTRKMTR